MAHSSSDALPDAVLMQSAAEWDSRNEILTRTLSELVSLHLPPGSRLGLDVGCQDGGTTDVYASLTGLEWVGVDPSLEGPRRTPGGTMVTPGYAHELDFPDQHFDCVMFANVYEHVLPDFRARSLVEIRRVLKPGGVVVGQIPNPYFPIESHSRLLFMGWLPTSLQHRYWRLAPVRWEHDFFVVTPKHLSRDASAAGLRPFMRRNFNYPESVIPQRVRWVARLLERPMRSFPWAWQFVLKG